MNYKSSRQLEFYDYLPVLKVRFCILPSFIKLNEYYLQFLRFLLLDSYRTMYLHQEMFSLNTISEESKITIRFM